MPRTLCSGREQLRSVQHGPDPEHGAVTAQNYFNENHANTVALLKDDLLLKWYVSYYYPDWNIVEYNSLKDAEAAMRSGENDCLLAESGEVAKYREDKRLHSVFLTQDGNVSFAWHAEMSP